jgi:hypothetical protein
MRYWCAVFMALPALACAEQDPFAFLFNTAPSALTVEGGGDDAGSRHASLDADLALSSGLRFILGGASAHVASSTASYNSSSLRIGVNSDPLERWSKGLTLSTVSQSDGLHYADFRGNLRWRPKQWSLAAYPQWRNISVPRLNAKADEVVRSPGLGVSASYRGFKRWSLSVNHAVYSYSTFSGKITPYGTAQISDTFDAARTGVSAGYAFAWGTVSASWDHGSSALTRAVYDSSALEVSWDVRRAYSLFARAGQGSSSGTAGHSSLSAGVTYFWD